MGRSNVARGLVPRLGGEQPAHSTITGPNHLRIRDTQHRNFGDRKHAPYPDTGPESKRWLEAKTLETFLWRTHSVLIPWCAGTSRDE